MSTAAPASKPSGQWQPPTLEEMQAMLPQYAFEKLLGRGGMGAVYKAVQVSLQRSVAIKVLPGDLIDDLDGNFAERFKNEARTMAKVNHPGIVKVFDFGETKTGLLYIVMEFIDGTDVAQMIRSKGKLPQDYALAITAHVGDALAYAHKNGVIHRDIKPANILINQEGAVKVADFGLAKVNDPNQSGLTKTNMAMGTPDFVAPEALSPGTVVDGRADLYAMGVMLYQMLTGEIPRGMWSMPSTKVGSDPRFDAVIQKAMQTDRELRYQDATEIRHDLDVIMTQPLQKEEPKQAAAPAPSARPEAPRSSRSIPQKSTLPVRPVRKKSNDAWVYLVAVVVIGGAVGLFMLSGGTKPAARASAEPEAATAPAPVASTASNEAPKPGPAASSVWQPVFTEELKRNPNITVLPDGWLLAKTNVAASAGRDIAMRARARLGKSSYIWPLLVRDRPIRGLSHYGVNVTKNTISLHLRDMDGSKYTPEDKDLQSVPLPRTLGENDEFDLEITCRGDQITVAFDGKILIDVRNTFCTGRRNLFAGELKNLEWRDLSGDPTKTPASAAPVAMSPPSAAAATSSMDLATRQKSLAAPLESGVIDALAGVTFPTDPDFQWTRTGGGIAVKPVRNPGPYKSTVELPAPPAQDYVIEAWFTNAASRANDVGLCIPVGGQTRTTCWIWARDGGWAGLGKVDGYDPQHPQIEKGRSTLFQLKPDELSFMRVEVRRQPGSVDIQFHLNGTLVAHYTGPTGRLILSTAWRVVKNHDLPCIGGREATFHRVTLQALGAVTAVKENKAAVTTAPPMPAPVPANGDPYLVKLESGFKARYETDAQKPFQAAVATLNQNYAANGIARARAAAQAGDRAALDAEKAAIEKGGSVPAEDAAGTPESLKGLRGTYRTAHAKLVADRDAKAAPLYDIYVKALDAHVIELTKADKIKQAREVQALREEIAARRGGPVEAPKTSAPTPAPAAAAPAGDSRKAAEYLVSVGGVCVVIQDGRRIEVKSAQDVPAGAFDLVELRLNSSIDGRPRPKNADFQVFNGLTKLRVVTMQSTPLTDDAFAFLAGNPGLTDITMQATPVSDKILAHIAGLKQLKNLYIFHARDFTGKGLEKAAFLPGLVNVYFYDTQFDDAGAAALSACQNLQRLHLYKTPVTDRGFKTIQALKSLTWLTISGTSVSGGDIERFKAAHPQCKVD